MHPLRTQIRALLALLLLLSWTAPLAAQGPPDENGTFRFSQASFNFAEEVGQAEITVQRFGGSVGDVSVRFTTADGSATAPDDYEAVDVVLMWADGDAASQTVQVPLVDDDLPEGLETVELVLSEPTGGATLHFPLSRATLRILPSDLGGGDGDDDDGEDNGDEEDGDDENDFGADSVVRFDQRTYHTRENVGVSVITVARHGTPTGPVSVEFSTTELSATPDEDYEPVAGTLEWADGEDGLKTFSVPILDDQMLEPTERIGLLLSGVTGEAVIHPSHGWAMILIHDDDQNGGDDNRNGFIGFLEESFQVIEGSGEASVQVIRRGGLQGVVTVDFATADAGATEGLDYEATMETLLWSHGEGGVKEVRIPILDDMEEESTEDVQLLLSNLTGGARFLPGGDEALLSILDDDSPETTCAADDGTLCLQDGRFQARVTWRLADGSSGAGRAAALSGSSGTFWFFSPDNVEMLLKVLDACGLAGFESYWVFFAATTNVDFTLTVVDTQSGVTKEYTNLLGDQAAPVQDTFTFKTCQ